MALELVFAHLRAEVEMPIVKLSQQVLLAVKNKANAAEAIRLPENIHPQSLLELSTDNYKKAFWINIYNACTQQILEQHPEIYLDRSYFFTRKHINIGGKRLSLDDIEHGILRHSKIKWSLGYLNKWFPPVFEKQHRVKKVDYRIHFALNCGAQSCPAIAFYDEVKIDQQLDLATRVYLQSESYFEQEKDRVTVPALMRWFRKDFGGKKGITSILKYNDIIPGNSHPSIRYKTYNWTKLTDNYKPE